MIEPSARIALSWRIRATIAATALPVVMELVSFERLQRTLLALTKHTVLHAPSDEVVARWVDDALAGRPWPWRRTCLRRAAVIYYLLRKAGRHVDLCIGVRRDEAGVLQAHAWLLCDDVPYLEPATTEALVPKYGVIARFPAPALQA